MWFFNHAETLQERYRLPQTPFNVRVFVGRNKQNVIVERTLACCHLSFSIPKGNTNWSTFVTYDIIQSSLGYTLVEKH